MKSIIDQPENQALIEAYVDGSIDESESVRLKALLTEEPEAVEVILKGIRDEVLIRSVLAELTATNSAVASPRRRGFFGSLRWPNSLTLPIPFYWRRVLAIGAGACLALAFLLFIRFFMPVTGEPVLTSSRGDGISLERSGKLEVATDGVQLQAGDLLRTSAGSTVVISYLP